MSALTIGAIVGLILLLTLAIGIPVAFALGLTAILSIVIFLTPAEFAFFADFVFASLNDFATWVCSFSMILRRLEVFTILVLLTPQFWNE